MTNQYPLLLPFLFLFLLEACTTSSDNESIPPQEEEILIVDEEVPQINTNALTGVLEEKFLLNITIDDDSSVNTSIYINENEVFTSDLKQFSYEINPYLIAVGETNLKIVSRDIFDNESEKVFTFEVKHFLFDFNLSASEKEGFSSLWIFFNDLEGNHLAIMEPIVGSNRIYTDEIIEGNEIFYTISKLTELGGGQTRNLRITTYRVELGEKRNALELNTNLTYDNYVQVDINREVEDNGYQKYIAKGSNYWTSLFGGGGFLTRIGINYVSPSKVFVRTDLANGIPELFDGKKENYRYISFIPSQNQPIIELNEIDFKPSEGSIPLTINDHISGSFDITRYGFENQEALSNNINHIIYEVDEPSDQYRDLIDLPVIDGLEFYNNVVVYQKDGKSFYGHLFGDNIDVSMPNWELSFSVENNKIQLVGENDLDYYAVRFFKRDHSDFNHQKSMIWDYRTTGKDTGKVTAVLDFPSEIQDDINDSFFKKDTDLKVTSVSALDFEEFTSFSETMDWLGLIKTKLTPDRMSYKQVTFFPTDTHAGKEMDNFKKEGPF